MAKAGCEPASRNTEMQQTDITSRDNPRQVWPVAPDAESGNLADWQLDRQFRRLRRWFAVSLATELCRQGHLAECRRRPGPPICWWCDGRGILHRVELQRYITRPLILRVAQDQHDYPRPSAATMQRLGAREVATVRNIGAHLELNCLPSELAVSIRFIAAFVVARTTHAALPPPPVEFTNGIGCEDSYIWSSAAESAHDEWREREAAAREWRRRWRERRKGAPTA